MQHHKKIRSQFSPNAFWCKSGCLGLKLECWFSVKHHFGKEVWINAKRPVKELITI